LFNNFIFQSACSLFHKWLRFQPQPWQFVISSAGFLSDNKDKVEVIGLINIVAPHMFSQSIFGNQAVFIQQKIV